MNFDASPMGEGAAADELWTQVKTKFHGFKNRPVHDPKLYELTEFI